MRKKQLNFFNDTKYRIFRIIMFWFFCAAFFVAAPWAVYISLGYRFNSGEKRFVRTGALQIDSSPEGATVDIAGYAANRTTPCVVRDLLPGKYFLRVVKKGFYPYSVMVEILPSRVYEANIALAPLMGGMEPVSSGLYVYRFFISKKIFGDRILAFTDKGIYMLNKYFSGQKMISPLILGPDAARGLEGLIDGSDNIVFWDKSRIWAQPSGAPEGTGDGDGLIYVSPGAIKNVFLGLKDHYAIVHDGNTLVAVNIAAPAVSYRLMDFKADDAQVFYDSDKETLYIKDKGVSGMEELSKTQLVRLLPFSDEEKKYKKNP